jgi:predicted nucleotidyltransferase
MKPIFVTMVGSRLYGINTEKSDIDHKGFAFAEVDEIIGLKNFEQQMYTNNAEDGPTKVEGTIYSVDRYVNLCMKGNPTVIEIAFAGENHWLHYSQVGVEVINYVKENFLTKSLFKPYSAYHMAQMRKLQSMERTGKRAEMVKELGYDAKFASHAFRLARQCVIVMKEGILRPTLDPEDRELCMRIRSGTFTKEEALEILNDVDKQMYSAYKDSTLPEAPDFNKANDFVTKLHMDYLHGKFDDQFKEFTPF